MLIWITVQRSLTFNLITKYQKGIQSIANLASPEMQTNERDLQHVQFVS